MSREALAEWDHNLNYLDLDFAFFLSAFGVISIISLPLYDPQLAHKTCGKIFEPHLLQIAKVLFFKAKWLRRWPCLDFVLRCLGTPIMGQIYQKLIF